MAITQPVRGSRRAVRWAVLEPRVALVEGLRAETTTNGSLRVGLGQHFEGALVPAGPGPGVARGQDPPVHGGEVGGEDELGPDGLLHLGGVAVVEQPVGGEILVHRAKLRGFGQLAPRPRDPAGGVHHDARGLDEPAADQRGQGQGGRSHVATGAPPPAGRRPGPCGRARAGRTRRRPAVPGRCARRRTRSGKGRGPSGGNRRPGRRHGPPAAKSSGTSFWEAPWGRAQNDQVRAVGGGFGRRPKRRPG